MKTIVFFDVIPMGLISEPQKKKRKTKQLQKTNKPESKAKQRKTKQTNKNNQVLFSYRVKNQTPGISAGYEGFR